MTSMLSSGFLSKPEIMSKMGFLVPIIEYNSLSIDYNLEIQFGTLVPVLYGLGFPFRDTTAPRLNVRPRKNRTRTLTYI